MPEINRKQWTAKDVLECLIVHYMDELRAANFVELTLPSEADDPKYQRRADLISVLCGGAYENSRWTQAHLKAQDMGIKFDHFPDGWRVGFEVKVSKADLRTDFRDGYKQAPLARICHQFYYVWPRGMIDHQVDEVRRKLPWGAGIFEVFHDERPRWLGRPRAALVRPARIDLMPETPPWLVNTFAKKSLYGRPTVGTAALKAAWDRDMREEVREIEAADGAKELTPDASTGKGLSAKTPSEEITS